MFDMLGFRLFFLYLTFLSIDSATVDNDVYFIINAPTSTAQSVRTLPDGYIHHPDIKMAYKIYTNRLNWTSAEEACNTEGGHLAVIDTLKKLEYIKNIRPWRNLVWTGIHRESRIGEWRAVQGGQISSDLPKIHYIPFNFGNCIAASGLITLTRLRVMSSDATRWYACEISDTE